MKLNAQQALVMFEVLKWSTQVYGDIAGYNPEQRLKLVNEIITQQGKNIVDLNDEPVKL